MDGLDRHRRARAGLCLICLDKSFTPIPNSRFVPLVENFIVSSYQPADERLPSGLCSSCSKKLLAYEQNDFSQVLPEFPDYSAMKSFRPVRGDSCSCFLCSRHRVVGLKSSRKKSKKLQNGKQFCKQTTDDAENSNPGAGLFCMKCFTLLYHGARHPCNLESQRENVKRLLPKKSLEILASDVLQEKQQNGESLSLATRGSPMSLVKNDKKYRSLVEKSQQKLTLETLHRAKAATGVSDNIMKKFVRELRSDVKVESGLSESLIKANQKFTSLFEAGEEKSPGNGHVIPFVCCKNVRSFLFSIMDGRATNPGDTILRLSVDEGRGFLKVSASLVFRDPSMETDRFKSSSVKRCFILAISPVKESYMSIKLLLTKLELDLLPEDLEDIFASDLKCLNIVCGLGNHRSMWPCIYCYWKNGF